MKKLFTLFLAVTIIGLVPAFGQQQEINLNNDAEKAPEMTQIEFTQKMHNFGNIPQGEVVKHKFEFKNVGEHDLIIENVKPSCGCTALDWPRKAIKPGKTGFIEAQFNSAGKLNAQTKHVTVIYNGNPKMELLTFKGNVVKPTPGEKRDDTNNDPAKH